MKNTFLIIICVFALKNAIAQEQNNSKWSVYGSVMPNIAGYYKYPLEGSGSYSASLYVDFEPSKHISLRGGISYNYNDMFIGRLYDTTGNGSRHGYVYYFARIHYLELPLIADVYVIKSNKNKFYVSFGDISSFEIAQNNLNIGNRLLDYNWHPAKGTIRTLSYQNYIQIGFGIEHKFSSRWSGYINPTYRYGLINYYTQGYLYRAPSAAYQALTGIEVGAKYNFLKIKPN